MKLLWSYICALFNGWLAVFSTLATAAGAVAWLLDDALPPRFFDTLPRDFYIGIAVLLFAWVNFQLYVKSNPGPEIVFRPSFTGLGVAENGTIITNEGEFQERARFVLSLNAYVSNFGRETSVEVLPPAIYTTDPRRRGKSKGAKATDITVKVSYRDDLDRRFDHNPFYLRPNEAKNQVAIRVDFSIDLREVERSHGSVRRLSKLYAKVGVATPGKQPVFQIVECSLDTVHERIRSFFVGRFQHPQNRLPPADLMTVYERYATGLPPAEQEKVPPS